MKKLIPIMIVGILILSGVGSLALSNNKTNDIKIQIESITISEPIITDVGQYVTVNLKEGTSFLFYSGEPMLPVLTKVLTFPFGTKIRNVDVSFSDTNNLVLSKEVNPVPEYSPVDANVVKEPIKDLTVYKSAAMYPASNNSYTVGTGLNGTEHVVYLAVQCYPVRYSPMKNILEYSKNAEIHVTYKEPAAPRVFADKYDLVIISPSEFSNDLQPLITHKISMEVNTILKTTEEIYSQYNGRDNAEKIKYFIKDAIETWGIHYVLLVGGIDKLPIRTSYPSIIGESIITDLYYADIYNATGDFCSWDKDGNGKYGEIYLDPNNRQVYDIDGVDLYPDVNVGRLPCENNVEVKTVVGKIIHYETETYRGSWFNHIILVGGDTIPGYNGYEGEEQNQITERIMSNFTPIQLWTSDGTFTAQALNNAINKGAGFVDYSGHGFEIGVATHPPNSSAWVPYHTNNLFGTRNGYKFPIAFFDACLTAKLDFVVYNLTAYLLGNLNSMISKFKIESKLLPCFAWCCVAKSEGGFIATIGATRYSLVSNDFGAGYLAIHFWQAYATSKTVSQMMTKALNDCIMNIPGTLFSFWTIEEFILIGDPSLRVGGYPTIG